ncbi:STAS domain-containing protein [Streptomyces sp. G-G2]|uniref:STAS domain-containing protein n=1 Tax=Streptomyces sp. G-G2 TaxID=3046201 RepID=UPI0024BBB5FB|nr:STAS domain-containing protein [Streptomyces sp. G-G2]MDJ0383554.1 STAS domain-containing protein [Streptomyces sp. G-G2]
MISTPRRAARPHTPTVVLGARRGLIRLAGELDLETAPAVRDGVRRCLDTRPDLLRIDISGVSFCDCSGIGSLLWAKDEAARAGIGFHLIGPLQPVVARVLDATGTAAHFGLTQGYGAQWESHQRDVTRTGNGARHSPPPTGVPSAAR